MGKDCRDEVRAQQRATKDDARQQGIGPPEEGEELPAPSYTDDTGSSYLGAEEPVVPEPLKGEPDGERGTS